MSIKAADAIVLQTLLLFDLNRFSPKYGRLNALFFVADLVFFCKFCWEFPTTFLPAPEKDSRLSPICFFFGILDMNDLIDSSPGS